MPESNSIDLTRRSFLAAASQGILAASAIGAAATQLSPPDKQPANLRIGEPPGKKVGWAIVGLGQLALGQIMPAFATCTKSRPAALVSGHPDKAQKVAACYGVDPKKIYNYENFDSIKNDPEIEAVYIVLPNSMHAEYTIRTAKAGKHVLCEKPMCVTVDEARQMIDACKAAQRKLMIAYRLHLEPYNLAMIDLARKQTYGKVKYIEAQDCQNTQAPNTRLSKELGGGPLGDVGVYCLNATRYITGEEPIEFAAMMNQPSDVPRFAEVPESVVWTQRFPSGVIATCACSFGMHGSKRYRVVCENGWYQLENAFGYSGQRMMIHDDQGTHEVTKGTGDHFARQMDHFSDCVMSGKEPVTPGEEGLADMKAMALIEESARTARVVRANQA
ncbi:MAG TPA: Gfo/Idh/MocA family oxidoreductase [Tepidisphaeraceae bacterium]|jgi:predicted dehydrogenase